MKKERKVTINVIKNKQINNRRLANFFAQKFNENNKCAKIEKS